MLSLGACLVVSRGFPRSTLFNWGAHHEILAGCLAWDLLESTATVAMTTSATTPRERVGNSGVVEEVEDVLVDARATLRGYVPELPALLESPP